MAGRRPTQRHPDTGGAEKSDRTSTKAPGGVWAFWATVPGLLAAIAAIMTATVGVIGFLHTQHLSPAVAGDHAANTPSPIASSTPKVVDTYLDDLGNDPHNYRLRCDKILNRGDIQVRGIDLHHSLYFLKPGDCGDGVTFTLPARWRSFSAIVGSTAESGAVDMQVRVDDARRLDLYMTPSSALTQVNCDVTGATTLTLDVTYPHPLANSATAAVFGRATLSVAPPASVGSCVWSAAN